MTENRVHDLEHPLLMGKEKNRLFMVFKIFEIKYLRGDFLEKHQ